MLVRTPPVAWIFISCEICMLSGRGRWDGLIVPSEKSYRVWWVWVWSWSLDNEDTLAHWELMYHEKKNYYSQLPAGTTTKHAMSAKKASFQTEIWNQNLANMYVVTRLGHSITCLIHSPSSFINRLNPELNPICYLLALLAHHFLHVSRIRVKSLTLRLLMSYIYGAPILDVSRSHTTTQHSR